MSSPATLQECPNCLTLYITSLFDIVCGWLKIPWREYLPTNLQEFFVTEMPPGFYESLGNPQVLPSYSDYIGNLTQHKIDIDSFFNKSNLMQYAFHTPSTALGDLTSKDAIVALLLLVFVLRRLKSFFIPQFCEFGRKMGRSTHGMDWEYQNEDRIVKFGEYVYRLLYHSSVSIFGLSYFCKEPWWNLDSDLSGIRYIFVNHPHHEISVGMIWYYLFQAAYNVDAVLHLLQLSFVLSWQKPFKDRRFRIPIHVRWSSTVRGDFREMLIHHIVTNLLIFVSSWFRFTRGGSMVFLVHDLSDVPVDLSKLSNFMKWKTATIACFVTMVIVWMATRLIVLPLYIFRGVLKYSHLLVTENGTMDVRFFVMYRPLFYSLFALLIILHVFWFYIFIRIALDLVNKSELHDYSEHKNGESSKNLSNGKKVN